MNIDVALPQGTKLTFRRGDKVVLSVEAVYLDLILVSSQKATSRRIDDDDHLWWLPKFTALLNARYSLDLSDTEAWTIAHTCHKVSQQLKKTFESIQTLLANTESTLSSSPETSSKDSTSTSPAAEQSENLKSEFATNL